jgi:hypothetical protein
MFHHLLQRFVTSHFPLLQHKIFMMDVAGDAGAKVNTYQPVTADTDSHLSGLPTT